MFSGSTESHPVVYSGIRRRSPARYYVNVTRLNERVVPRAWFHERPPSTTATRTLWIGNALNLSNTMFIRHHWDFGQVTGRLARLRPPLVTQSLSHHPTRIRRSALKWNHPRTPPRNLRVTKKTEYCKHCKHTPGFVVDTTWNTLLYEYNNTIFPIMPSPKHIAISSSLREHRAAPDNLRWHF